MNRARVSKAYEKIAEGYAELALAFADEQPAAGVGISPARAPAPVDDLPPIEEPPTGDQFDAALEYEPKVANLKDQHVENVLSQCPTHQRPWTIKPAGVSKAGKPYNAFWKCGEKDSSTRSGYCDKKPVKAWADAHPAEAAA